jgi:hypothetical protein
MLTTSDSQCNGTSFAAPNGFKTQVPITHVRTYLSQATITISLGNDHSVSSATWLVDSARPFCMLSAGSLRAKFACLHQSQDFQVSGPIAHPSRCGQPSRWWAWPRQALARASSPRTQTPDVQRSIYLRFHSRRTRGTYVTEVVHAARFQELNCLSSVTAALHPCMCTSAP